MRFPARRELLIVLAAAATLAGCGGKTGDVADTALKRIEATKTLRVGLEGT
jgi:L-cystine transport system substrate-binding protein